MKKFLISLITSDFCEGLNKGFGGLDKGFGDLSQGFEDLGKSFCKSAFCDISFGNFSSVLSEAAGFLIIFFPFTFV